MLRTDQLEKALKNYPYFHGVYAVDQLPDQIKRGLYIANTDPSDEPGEHWVLFYKTEDGVTEFFDTFGRKPRKRWDGEWKYNTRIVQSPVSAACGYHVLYFAHLRRFHPFEKIIGNYGMDLVENDMHVTRIVKNVFGV